MQLAYFGKLSSRGDFVRQNGSTPAVRALDVWIQNGLRKLGQRIDGGLGGAFDNAGSSGFVLRHLDAPGPAIGTIRPSRDESGRTYPFFVVLQLDQRDTDRVSSLQLAREHAEFLASSGRAVEAAVSGDFDTSDLDDWIRKTTDRLASGPGSLSGADSALDSILFSTLCERLWGSFDDDSKAAVFHNLWSVFAPLRDPDHPIPGYGVQIPLASKDLLFVSMEFWMKVCDRLIGRSGLHPSVIWNTRRAHNGSPPLLYLNYSKLPPSGMVHVLQVDLDLESVFRTDLTRGRAASDIRTAMDASMVQLMDDDQLTLQQFVDSIR